MRTPIIPQTNFKASDCGNSFQVEYSDGNYKYMYVGGRYYTQKITPTVKPVVEITRQNYLIACQYLKDNISLCGSNFTIMNPDDINGIQYWFDGIYFYRQAFGSVIKSVPVKITKQEFINNCSNRF